MKSTIVVIPSQSRPPYIFRVPFSDFKTTKEFVSGFHALNLFFEVPWASLSSEVKKIQIYRLLLTPNPPEI
jgi:hypothetical protein